jgi:hypothetical protein
MKANWSVRSLGRWDFKNHVSLSHSNILQRTHEWARFCMKKQLGVTLPGILFHMCKIPHGLFP